MKKLTLLIVFELFCCGFTKIGHAQNIGDLNFLLQKFENAKKVDSIVGYLPTDSIIGYISILPDYRDIPLEEDGNESGLETEGNKVLLVEKRQALLRSFRIDVPLDETKLTDEQKVKLEEVAQTLNKYPDVRVHIFQTNLYKYRGTSYSRGKGLDDRDDMIFKYAIAAKKYLVLKGVSEERLKIEPIPL